MKNIWQLHLQCPSTHPEILSYRDCLLWILGVFRKQRKKLASKIKVHLKYKNLS